MKKLLFVLALFPLLSFGEELHILSPNESYSGDVNAATPDTLVWSIYSSVLKTGFYLKCDSTTGTGTNTKVWAKCRGIPECGGRSYGQARSIADSPFIRAQFRTGENAVEDSVDFTTGGLLVWDVPDSLAGSGVNPWGFVASDCIECIIAASDTMQYKAWLPQK